MNIVTNNKWIGQRTIRPDGADKVTGRAAFAADTNMPGMIWGKVLRSPHPHARIKSIDTSKAEALPGVKAWIEPLWLSRTFLILRSLTGCRSRRAVIHSASKPISLEISAHR